MGLEPLWNWTSDIAKWIIQNHTECRCSSTTTTNIRIGNLNWQWPTGKMGQSWRWLANLGHRGSNHGKPFYFGPPNHIQLPTTDRWNNRCHDQYQPGNTDFWKHPAAILPACSVASPFDWWCAFLTIHTFVGLTPFIAALCPHVRWIPIASCRAKKTSVSKFCLVSPHIRYFKHLQTSFFGQPLISQGLALRPAFAPPEPAGSGVVQRQHRHSGRGRRLGQNAATAAGVESNDARSGGKGLGLLLVDLADVG